LRFPKKISICVRENKKILFFSAIECDDNISIVVRNTSHLTTKNTSPPWLDKLAIFD
jgi:hypothetical protein